MKWTIFEMFTDQADHLLVSLVTTADQVLSAPTCA